MKHRLLTDEVGRGNDFTDRTEAGPMAKGL
jgi:hypothetical protein